MKPALFFAASAARYARVLEAEGGLSEQVLTQGVVKTSNCVGVTRQTTTNQRGLFVEYVVDTNEELGVTEETERRVQIEVAFRARNIALSD